VTCLDDSCSGEDLSRSVVSRAFILSRLEKVEDELQLPLRRVLLRRRFACTDNSAGSHSA
jgi:hypothetical protein